MGWVVVQRSNRRDLALWPKSGREGNRRSSCVKDLARREVHLLMDRISDLQNNGWEDARLKLAVMLAAMDMQSYSFNVISHCNLSLGQFLVLLTPNIKPPHLHLHLSTSFIYFPVSDPCHDTQSEMSLLANVLYIQHELLTFTNTNR